MPKENVSKNPTEELIKEVAELLGVEYVTVKWDMSKESIIEGLVKVIRKSGVVERVEKIEEDFNNGSN